MIMSEAPQTSTRWQPAIPLSRVAARYRQSAEKLRRALRQVLVFRGNPNITRRDFERIGLEDYEREFGIKISDRYLRELIKRTVDRDGGANNWERLEIYLPDRLAAKETAAAVVSEAVAHAFGDIADFVSTCTNPGNLSSAEQQAVWALAFKSYREMVDSGEPAKRAARHVREMLLERAPSLASSRDALLKAFNRKLEKIENAGGELIALKDGRAANGNSFEVPEEDIDRLRASATFKNGGRIDAAWREEYHLLSAQTRARFSYSLVAPRKIHEALVREKVDSLLARHQGKRVLKRMIGGVERDWTGIPCMREWVVDDLTANIEVTPDTPTAGSELLFTPQVVAVMDSASRKFVGWAISNDKGPTAALSCAAILDGFKTHGVPQMVGVENGFVFGKSLNINGKEDGQGRTVVAGLAQYGCTVRHFDRMNPTSKAELEKGFDLLQQKMERHPGYTGRLQMLDAPESFKREQRLIKSGKMAPKEYRYTFSEFVEVMAKIFAEYNAHPQRGHLGGISPNEAHEALKDKANPPIRFTSEMEWLLANERYRVTVEPGGVRFTHYGESVRVRGGRLTELVGSELWALIARDDNTVVTFMNLNFTDPFTLEACEKPSANERTIAPGSGTLGRERAKIREHERAVDEEYKDLVQRYGNPRRDLLMAVREKSEAETPDRTLLVSPRLANSANAMNEQREEIKQKRRADSELSKTIRTKARKLGVPESLVTDSDEDTQRALARRERARKNTAAENTL